MPANAHQLKALEPGWIMMMTPSRPMQVAVQRRQPTLSPRNKAEAAVMVSGLSWVMAIRSG
jgi:hypothetical protein